MPHFIRLLGGLAVLIECRPGAARANVSWLCAEAWGRGIVAVPAEGWPVEEWGQRWADAIAGSVKSGAGVEIVGGCTWRELSLRAAVPGDGAPDAAFDQLTPTRAAPLAEPTSGVCVTPLGT